jgi:hypothetical protein
MKQIGRGDSIRADLFTVFPPSNPNWFFEATLLRAGDAVESRFAVANIGRSSRRPVHRVARVNDGGCVAAPGQMEVHLNLDQLKPTPFPEDPASRPRQMTGS